MAKVYCVACNEVFSARTAKCPRCGLNTTHTPNGTATETLLLTHDGKTSDEPIEITLDHDLLDGQQIHIYTCERMLGRGGMGVVYLARNQQLHRFCALKVLSPKRVSSEFDYIARFENEARAAAALVHGNIVTTHAIGRWEDMHFLEMEYVAGTSLQQEIDSYGALGPIRSTAMAVGIASGLAAAHRMGIIHRDLKPDNVIVTPASVPKIADFGLAKRIVGDDLPTNNLAGTPYYMAPELFEGKPATTSSDVFALGVCYYQMLTGCYPFQGESISEVMNAILAGNCISVRRRNPDIPLDIAECVSLLLAPDPDRRPRDGGAASQLLQAVMGAVRDLESLIYEAFHDLPSVECHEDEHAKFQIRLTLRNNRHQVVYVENSEHGAGDRLLLIYSVCCDARSDFFEQALRLNASVHHGGIAIREINGQPCFVMIDTYPRATVAAEQIRRSVLEVAAQADEIERILTGRDVN
ncbi:MAG: serine/threonine protein kinase [Planctomycetaceae bacterium]|nr:serine/threonine protein kinase [Planctomycetaceae bacterium]